MKGGPFWLCRAHSGMWASGGPSGAGRTLEETRRNAVAQGRRLCKCHAGYSMVVQAGLMGGQSRQGAAGGAHTALVGSAGQLIGRIRFQRSQRCRSVSRAVLVQRSPAIDLQVTGLRSGMVGMLGMRVMSARGLLHLHGFRVACHAAEHHRRCRPTLQWKGQQHQPKQQGAKTQHCLSILPVRFGSGYFLDFLQVRMGGRKACSWLAWRHVLQGGQVNR